MSHAEIVLIIMFAGPLAYNWAKARHRRRCAEAVFRVRY